MKKSLTYVEIDVDFCSLTYGTAPCTASIPTTGTKKCFNTPSTCQDRLNFSNSPVTIRFSLEGVAYAPSDIEATPSIVSVGMNPGKVSLGQDLGERASISVQFRDHRHSDTGPAGDKYLADRSYDPWKQGTFWGKFRNRHLYLKGRPLRLIRGYLGQSLAEMKTRHYVIESMTGPDTNAQFTIVAKDILKLLDDDRAQCPDPSETYLSADITNVATTAVLSPSGEADNSLPTSGHLAIAGKEIVQFNRKPSADSFTKLLLHCNGADASTTFTDSSSSPHTVTRNGNAQVDTAQSKFGGAALLLDGVDDYLILDGSSDFAFGTGDFTIDLWFRLSSLAAGIIYDSRPNATTGAYPTLIINGLFKVIYHANNADRITGTTTLVANTWYHLVVTRYQGNTRLFLNGTQEGSTYVDSTNYLNPANRPVIGTNGNNTTINEFVGWLDEIEVSKGVARWTSNFTSTTIETSNTSGNTVAITRGQMNTTAAAHKQDDRVQIVKVYSSQDPADIIYDLCVTHADVDPSYIDLESWKIETGTYLNRLYSARIAEPTGVKTLISELIEQACLAMWWDDESQLIRLQVLRSIPTTADTYTEGEVIDGSLSIREQPELRISQVWTYFDQRDPLQGVDESDNYKSIAVTVDLQRETDYGSAAIKKIFSRWIPNGGRAIALRVNDIQIGRYGDPPREFEFVVMSDDPIELGGGYKISSWAIQDDEGASALAPIQVTRLAQDSAMTRVEAQEVLFNLEDEDPNNRVIILDTNQNNVNIRTIHDTLYPVITVVGSITLTVVVDTGVIIGSSAATLPALDIGTFPIGLPILLQVRGRVQGAGGNGGSATPANFNAGNGQMGGTAIYTRMAMDLDVDEGEVWGGGGGGGGSTGSAPIGGSGGGAGTVGGNGGNGNPPGSANGSPGTATAGGASGTGFNPGGAGGGPGLAGGNGSVRNGSGSAGSGGAAGRAIDGISYVTITQGPGDRRGPEVN